MGKYFKKLREESGLSQGELAKLLGWGSPQFISNIEREKAYYPKEKVIKLETIFGVPRAEMFKVIIKFRQHKIVEEYGL